MAHPNALSDLEKRLDGVRQDFTQQLDKIGGKETEKFDLIFAILTELQSRQAQLEESVRSLKAAFCGPQANGNAAAPSMTPQMQGQFNGGMGTGQQFGCGGNGQQGFVQTDGQMTSPGMGNAQPMQMMMQADGSQAMFTPMHQIVMVPTPTNGYQMPQMMSPTGQMQPMSPNMGMQMQPMFPGNEAANGAAPNGMKAGEDLKSESLPGKMEDQLQIAEEE
jgi:hypothetical protein